LLIHDKDGINATVETPTMDIPTSMRGVVKRIKTDQIGKITATPCGLLTDTLIAALFPHQSPVIGAKVFADSDVALLINSRDGKLITYGCAMLTKAPPMKLSTVATAFGAAEWTALQPATEATAFVAESALTYALDEPGEPVTGRKFAAEFGDLDVSDTMDGFTVEVEFELIPVVTDNIGTANYLLAGVTARASCTPVGWTAATLMGAVPLAKGRGESVTDADDLIIQSTVGLKVTLPNAAVVTGPVQFGRDKSLKAGQIGFVSTINTAGLAYKVELIAPAP
jgi:hypothetical protein